MSHSTHVNRAWHARKWVMAHAHGAHQLHSNVTPHGVEQVFVCVAMPYSVLQCAAGVYCVL